MAHKTSVSSPKDIELQALVYNGPDKEAQSKVKLPIGKFGLHLNLKSARMKIKTDIIGSRSGQV